MIKNILVITQEYPADDLEKEFTPVVHFFTREWVKQGYNVIVLNMPTNFPSIYYWGGKLIRRKIESRIGINIRTYPLSHKEYVLDGVQVDRIPLRKLRPHGRFSKKQIMKGIEVATNFCGRKKFKPDVIIGHWTNPTIDIMLGLKKIYGVPCALSMHDSGFDFKGALKEIKENALKDIDCWGFRSYPIKREFEQHYGQQEKSYMCFSGVPEHFMSENVNRNFKQIRNFLFVGLLMKRKHPFELVQALSNSELNDFSLDIVGEGNEALPIAQYIENHNLKDKVKLCGRISREQVGQKMQEADVFCMISNAEAFGLVYIEAMAAGCITIASRNEGFDGIIVDGVNGFLCEAGNVEELTSIFNKIIRMDSSSLNKISKNAVKTAQEMTDSKMAERYISDICKLLNI